MRIGIYSGTFDPIHKGHIAFALEAAAVAKLDKVYFTPEIKPKNKPHVSHFAHRLAMLNLVARSQPKLETLELPDKTFSVLKTLPKIKAKFKEDEISLLIGSDIFFSLPLWPNIEYLLDELEIVVGVRQGCSIEQIEKAENSLPRKPKKLTIIQTNKFNVSATNVRQEIIDNGSSNLTLASVNKYAKQHWLYTKLPKH